MRRSRSREVASSVLRDRRLALAHCTRRHRYWDSGHGNYSEAICAATRCNTHTHTNQHLDRRSRSIVRSSERRLLAGFGQPSWLLVPCVLLVARAVPSRLSCCWRPRLSTPAQAPRRLSPRSLLPAHRTSIASQPCAPGRGPNASAVFAPIPPPVARSHGASHVEHPFCPVSPAQRLVCVPARAHPHSSRALSTHLTSPEGPVQGEAGSSHDSLYSSSPCCGRPHPYLYYSSWPSCCCCCPRSLRPLSAEYLSPPSMASTSASLGTAGVTAAMGP
jgi:hypothetical protein